MARHKAFNEEDVIDKAVKVFWEKGYEATSMQDLIDAMGIQRGSLYSTFGSKQQLFLTSLKRYSVTVVASLLAILDSKPSAIASIELFFSQLVEHLLTSGELRSCLVTNSAIERGLRDEETRKLVLQLLKALDNGFYKALLRAKESGELSSEFDLGILSSYLTSSMQGLLVVGKVCSEREVLEGINRVSLSILTSQSNLK